MSIEICARKDGTGWALNLWFGVFVCGVVVQGVSDTRGGGVVKKISQTKTIPNDQLRFCTETYWVFGSKSMAHVTTTMGG